MSYKLAFRKFLGFLASTLLWAGISIYTLL